MCPPRLATELLVAPWDWLLMTGVGPFAASGAGVGVGLAVARGLFARRKRRPLPHPLAPVWLGVAGGLATLFVVAPRPPMVSAALAVAIAAQVTVQRMARARARPPNLAGWLVGPTSGVAVTLVDLGVRWTGGASSVWDARLSALGQANAALLVASVLLVGLGLTLALGAVSRQARQSGHAHRLSALAALLTTCGGLAECTRAQLHGWVKGDFASASAAWALHQQLLTGAVIVVVLAAASGWLRRPSAPWRTSRLGGALALALAAGLTGMAGWVEWTLRPLTGGQPAVARAPVCPIGACLEPDGPVAPGDGNPRDYPFFTADLAALDVRFSSVASPRAPTDPTLQDPPCSSPFSPCRSPPPARRMLQWSRRPPSPSRPGPATRRTKP